MSKSVINVLILSISLLFSAVAMAECASPSAPTVPDGNVATKDEMLTAKSEIEAYQLDLVKYRDCLKEQDAAIPADAEDAEAQRAAILDLYNTSVDVETAVGASFNNAIKLFNAANK